MSKYHDFYEAMNAMMPDDLLVWKTDKIGQMQKAVEMYRVRHVANEKRFRIVCGIGKLYVIRIA